MIMIIINVIIIKLAYEYIYLFLVESWLNQHNRLIKVPSQ